MMRKEMVGHAVIDFLQSRLIDQTADYMQSGCRFARLSDGELAARWFTSFRSMADAPSDPVCLAELNDVEAEMGIRNIAPPYDQAQSEVDRYLAAADAEIQDARRDPDRFSD